VLSGESLCLGLITRPEESIECSVSNECDREASQGEVVTRKRAKMPKKKKKSRVDVNRNTVQA
jgi:hypothetical protein